MHRGCMEKAEVDVIVILNFLEFGRAVVCDEDEVDQSISGARNLSWLCGRGRVMRRRLDIIYIN